MAVLVITRELKAGKRQVFDAWAKSENIAQWWGPKGFDTTAKSFDFKVGGLFHYSFQAGDAPAMWGKFVFREIEAPHKIVFVNAFSDEAGNLTRAPFSEAWPVEISNTMTLDEQDGITTLTLQGTPVNATPEEIKVFDENFESMRQGFGGTFDRLEDFLNSSK